MVYKDFSFDMSDSGICKEYSNTNAIILAIRNIILSRPGNFPFTPSLGINIAKYQFEFIDDYTISDIKTELLKQINQYIPSIDNVDVSVEKIIPDDNSQPTSIGISVSAVNEGEKITTNFLIIKEKEVVQVYNETV